MRAKARRRAALKQRVAALRHIGACAVDAPKTGLRVEKASPPPAIVLEVEKIAQAAQLDVGGIEFLVDDRDGRHYFYDINALSNFVADAPNVIGFDPFVNLVAYLFERAARSTWWQTSPTARAFDTSTLAGV